MAKKHPKDKYAWSITVGERGQIVIPKQAREVFGIEPGDSLLLLGDAKKGLAIPPKQMWLSLSQRIFGEENEE